MHFTLLPTLALVSLAVAAPTTNTTTIPAELNSTEPSSLLLKRSSNGWIGSASAAHCRTTGTLPKDAHKDDPNLMDGGWYMKPRPELTESHKCYPFGPQTDDVGVNWGSAAGTFTRLILWDNASCSGTPMFRINQIEHKYGTCFRTKDFPGLSAVMPMWRDDLKDGKWFDGKDGAPQGSY